MQCNNPPDNALPHQRLITIRLRKPCDVRQHPPTRTCIGHHLREQLGGDAASFTHLALLRVGHVGHHAHDLARARHLTGVGEYQHLHDVTVHISGNVTGVFKYLCCVMKFLLATL